MLSAIKASSVDFSSHEQFVSLGLIGLLVSWSDIWYLFIIKYISELNLRCRHLGRVRLALIVKTDC